MHPDTVKYNKKLAAGVREICELLAREIDAGLETIEVTPSKWPERKAPQRSRDRSGTLTTVLRSCPFGYISATVGTNSASTAARRRRALSAAMVRGYAAKSSPGPNCDGLTKMVTTTRSAARRARVTSAM